MRNNLEDWDKFYNKNRYYHEAEQTLVRNLIPANASVVEFGSKRGELLKSLPNKSKLGIEGQDDINKFFKTNKKKFDYVVLSHTLSETSDVQDFVSRISSISHEHTRVIVLYFNFLWKPILDLGEKLGLKKPDSIEPNWLSHEDIDNIFYLESWDKVKSCKTFLLPTNIPFISTLFNTYISQLPLFNRLGLINYIIYRPLQPKKDYSVSIIIPARNESGNMKGVLSKIPKIGKSLEVVFVEGNSKDDTYKAIQNEINRYKGPIKAKLYKQTGKGKGDAVRLGFSKAQNDVLMILDADLTVDPKELPKFYSAISEGKGELIMGSRLVYPMEKLAMRTLNVLGNKFFSIAFSFLLDQKIKDTLCGTKVLLKSDYDLIAKNRKIFGDFDPFGDYDLIFGAAKLNLKIVEIPIRYKQRTYGTTNISRFRHGLLLFEMLIFAAKKLKFV